jgi:putative peptidoglycan lipid II flippase
VYKRQVRDNLASRLGTGAVTSLTYGWMIMQVPETLIGTAIGTALLPTLAEYFARNEEAAFQQTIERAVRVLMALTLPIAAALALGLRPLLGLAFGFNPAGTDMLLWVTRGYLLGLAGQCLMEVAARSFYARQDALTPLLAGILNAGVYILLSSQLYRVLGAPGISLSDSLAFTSEAILLLILLNRRLVLPLQMGGTLLRALLGAALAGGVVLLVLSAVPASVPLWVAASAAMALGALLGWAPVWREVRILFKL